MMELIIGLYAATLVSLLLCLLYGKGKIALRTIGVVGAFSDITLIVLPKVFGKGGIPALHLIMLALLFLIDLSIAVFSWE